MAIQLASVLPLRVGTPCGDGKQGFHGETWTPDRVAPGKRRVYTTTPWFTPTGSIE
jgi:hypothetical protein